MKQLRWGFLGTAGIARKNWRAISRAENCTLTAVASRNGGRALAFINECQVDSPFAIAPQVLDSYEALLASPDVDAIYIPIPTALRHDWVIRAARAGKHILCEKPGDTSAVDLDCMLAVCRENRVQFMDGVMFMHHPRLDQVRQVLDDGVSVGSIRRIMSIFSFLGNEEFWRNNIRLSPALEPAGCLGDLGWYCLRFSLWAMNWQMPHEVTGRILRAHEGCSKPVSAPLEFAGELFFAEGVSAGFYCSFLAPNQRWANVTGTQGWLRMDDFVHPTNPLEPTFQLNDTIVSVRPGGGTDASVHSPVHAQDVNMFRNFAKQVRSEKLNEEWPQWTLCTQRVQDACLRSAMQGGHPVAVGPF